MMKYQLAFCLLAFAPLFGSPAFGAEPVDESPFVLVVMDPLAAPLSCPCVEGYAQRKYEFLSAYLSKELKHPVEVVFAESLSTAMKQSKGAAHIIVGKDSVVRSDAKKAKLSLEPVANLTGKDGSITQTGLIVVRTADPAKNVSDLKDYRIFFGPAECDEKYAAPLALLTASGYKTPAKIEISNACSDGACKIIELGKDARSAAVISSYAAPLLEGCGTIKKGDLRVVAETKPVPFVAAFTTDQLNGEQSKQAAAALLAVGADPELCLALETLVGFLPYDAGVKKN